MSVQPPKIKPVGSKILVLPEPPKEYSRNGIIIPMSVNSQLEEGTVISKSEDVSIHVNVGERILYPRTAGVEREFDGIKYKFLNGPTSKDVGDVWAII